MKFISWNVNGIRAAWHHGLAKFLEDCKADIYAFQETKTNEIFSLAELEGYHAFWSFSKRRGYSGTMCLSRQKPLRSYYGLGDAYFDTEGRIITLEFENFYFVNVYVPNPLRSEARYDYRNEWDERFISYASWLRNRKPTIICGDFNTTPSDFDIHTSRQVAQNAEVFQSSERESFLRIIDSGYTDAFRYLHPQKTDAYTWWSARHYKRSKNQGWRLDYFLVSDLAKNGIVEATIMSYVYGSDHCPISLVADMAGSRVDKSMFLKQEQERLRRNTISNHASKEALQKFWDNVNWEETEQTLKDWQMALAKVAIGGDLKQITYWQKKIVYSIEAKLMAVREICDSKKGAGVDHIKWTTSAEKMAGALSLTSKNYQALPSRMVLIRTKEGKERRINIKTYYDCAMLKLYEYGLAPVAESWGDEMSFAYRRGRSAFDLNEHVKTMLSNDDVPLLFIGDIRKCYESISHEWIMRNIPMAKSVLHQFLKSGYVFGKELFPQDAGINIGDSMSPTIANMVLNGLQAYIRKRLYPDGNIDFGNGFIIRYADDFLFTARTMDAVDKIKTYITEFLEERGLEMSYLKCRVVDVRKESFTFVGRTYTKEGKRILVVPSKESVERFMASVRDLIRGYRYKGSQLSLIRSLNRKIDGWATFHKVGDAEEIFKTMDAYITALLIQLCKAKHFHTWNLRRIDNKYFRIDDKDRHYYILVDKRKKQEVRVKFLEDTICISYQPVKSDVNPYIDLEYLENRENTRDIRNVTGVFRETWERQKGKCYYCGRKIHKEDGRDVVEVFHEHKRYADRIAYVHRRCMYGTFDFIDTNVTPASINDIRVLLEEIGTY